MNERLAESNLGLVHACARRFAGRGAEYDDLFQAGCVGLVKAAAAFDPSRGYAFSTYAVPVILGEIRRLFRDGGSVKVSRSLKERARALQQSAEEFARREGHEPTVGELADVAGLTTAETAELLLALRPTVSLSAEGEEGERVLDVPDGTEGEAHLTERLALHEELDALEETERRLIALRYYHGLTQSRTGALLGMTQVQVSRREKAVLAKLRERMTV